MILSDMFSGPYVGMPPYIPGTYPESGTSICPSHIMLYTVCVYKLTDKNNMPLLLPISSSELQWTASQPKAGPNKKHKDSKNMSILVDNTLSQVY